MCNNIRVLPIFVFIILYNTLKVMSTSPTLIPSQANVASKKAKAARKAIREMMTLTTTYAILHAPAPKAAKALGASLSSDRLKYVFIFKILCTVIFRNVP